tara:strand:- start:449 stop:658 length:210 start_codon:yes stop_codon:yes gene_type:complete
MVLALFQSTLAFSPTHTYKELSSTCQHAVAVSDKLSVQSIADCESRCDCKPAVHSGRHGRLIMLPEVAL